MAAFARTQFEVKKTGVSVTVPSNHKARLMYYLDCICTSLSLEDSDTTNLRRLRDYENYHRLSQEETDQLFVLCLAISPDVLLNKVIFQDDDMCGDSSNEFYEISAVRNQMVVSQSIIIAGKSRRVNKIMCFKMSWLTNNYIEPIKHFHEEMEARNRRRRQQNEEMEARNRRRRQQNDDCVIL